MIVESWCVCVGCLDIGHTSRCDNDHTFFGTVKGRQLFFISFLFTKNCDLVHGLDHGHVLGHDHGPVLDVVVLVDLGRTCGWTCDVPKVALPHLRRLWSLYWCA